MKPFYQIYEEAIAALLPDRKEYSRTEYGGLLYSRTQDFVQWLGFQTSGREEAVIAEYSIQALASQYDVPSVVVVSRVNNKSGENWWITPDELALQSNHIIESTIKQIRPDPYSPLVIKDILKLIKNSRLKS